MLKRQAGWGFQGICVSCQRVWSLYPWPVLDSPYHLWRHLRKFSKHSITKVHLEFEPWLSELNLNFWQCGGQIPASKKTQCTAWTRNTVTDNELLFSCSVLSDSLWPRELQHARLPCPSPTPRVCSDSCPLSQWCRLTISSSVTPFSSSIFPSIRVFSSFDNGEHFKSFK